MPESFPEVGASGLIVMALVPTLSEGKHRKGRIIARANLVRDGRQTSMAECVHRAHGQHEEHRTYRANEKEPIDVEKQKRKNTAERQCQKDPPFVLPQHDWVSQ